MSGTVTTAPTILMEDYRAVRSAGSLRGFCTKVTLLKIGMCLHDVGIYVDGDRAWAMPSSKVQVDRNGAALREPNGKLKYAPVVSFISREIRDRFSATIIEAWRAQCSDSATVRTADEVST